MVHISKIDLNLFVVFDAIYGEGGVTPASRRLHLSQPAVSHALSRLRLLFDDPLFERNGRAMAPTPKARDMIGRVRSAIQGLETTLNRPELFEPATAAARYSLAMGEALQSAILPALMRAIVGRAPGIDIAVVMADRRTVERDLATGAIDLALDVLLPLPDDIHRRRLCTEWLAVVVRQDHPRVGEALSLEEYLAEEHIAVSSRRRGLSAEDFELGRRDLRRRVRLRCQNYFAACETVRDSDLLLTMPRQYARILNPHFGNRLAAFPIDTPAYEIYAYWRGAAANDPANQWLRTRVIEALSHGLDTPPEVGECD